MTPLEKKIHRQIELEGPMTIADYWAHCLFDPQHGYYITRLPIGAAGDFTTAPEISQMFGEMLAAWWLATAHQNHIAPALVEIGPGRGTLMADMLRALGKLDAALTETLRVHMVEVSPRLEKMQQEALAGSGFQIQWHRTLASLPKSAIGIVANELFDAIPVRQFIKHAGAWSEGAISLNESGSLQLTTKPANLDLAILPAGHELEPDGIVFEYAPAREALIQDIAQHIRTHGGFGLFIDYGHPKPGFGDTLQAMRNHAYANMLESAGQSDITSHVDFQSLQQAALLAGLRATNIVTQREFLTGLGIAERANRLCKSQPQHRDSVETAIDRLLSPEQMGSLFKVLGISHPDIAMPGLQMAG